MAEEKTKALAKTIVVEEFALEKIKKYQESGMVLPEGFNPTNSLKKARFILNDMKVGGKPVLEVCTQSSIVQCLIDSVAKGLDFSETQIYFIPRGNQMTTLESVYGRILRAKRASKYYKPIVNYVHEGDEFELGVNVDTGTTKVIKHTTKLENLDKPIIAAYTYVTDNDKNTELYVMTKREWLTSWQKSPSKCAVAKEFEKAMIYRTIIKMSTKTLVFSNNNHFIASTEDENDILAGDNPPVATDTDNAEFTDFEEVTEGEQVDTETGEIKKPAKPAEVDDDDF